MKFNNLRVSRIIIGQKVLDDNGQEIIGKGMYRVDCCEDDLMDSKVVSFYTSRGSVKRMLKLLLHRGKDGSQYIKAIDKAGGLAFTAGSFPILKYADVDPLHENDRWILGNLNEIDMYRCISDASGTITEEDERNRLKLSMICTGDIRYAPVTKEMFLSIQNHGYYYATGTVRRDGIKLIVRHPYGDKQLEEYKNQKVMESIPEGNTATILDADEIFRKRDDINNKQTEVKEELEAVA